MGYEGDYMKFLKVASVEDAFEMLANSIKTKSLDIESVDVTLALGRVISEDVVSPENVPHFNRSVVDGYAVIAEETYGAGESMPLIFSRLGDIEMGKGTDVVIGPEQASYVPTGGALPEGADGVVMVEYTEELENSILISGRISKKENVMSIGDDIGIGEIIIKKGAVVRPQDIGAMVAIGITEVNVYKKPKIALISTGDELLKKSDKDYASPKKGQIRDINTIVLSSMAEKFGCEVIKTAVLKDDFEIIKSEIVRLSNICDIVAVSGGSSMGQRDMTADIFESIKADSVYVHGIAMKPGKPTILADLGDCIGMGLPGQPASAMMVFHQFLGKAVSQLTGRKETLEPYITGKLSENIPAAPGRKSYQMVKVTGTGDDITISPVYGKSGMITLLSESDGYIVIGSEQEGIVKGEAVKAYLWN